jgi:hypothetical protein
MKEEEIPLDLSFVFELAKTPSLEEELQLEKEIRIIRATDDIEGIKKYAEDIARRNHQQTVFISECLIRMANLHSKLVQRNKTKKNKCPNLLKKLLKLQ